MAWTGKDVIYLDSSELMFPEKRVGAVKASPDTKEMLFAGLCSNHFLKVEAKDDVAFVEIELM
jgi:hypothetical protein